MKILYALSLILLVILGYSSTFNYIHSNQKKYFYITIVAVIGLIIEAFALIL